MNKYSLKVEGMMCGMCEAHVMDAVRIVVPTAKKVKASRKKNLVTFKAEEVDQELLIKTITETGYTASDLEIG